jgi:alkanesulfonate monooxygenase SsuD/methylene tetrahydromethanopterin reductase-like flavin-dependent oxidoreductase (luciferase family)
MAGLWSPVEEAMVGHAFREAVVGSPATVRRGIAEFLERTGVDELMVTAAIYDHAARLRSFELVANVRAAR